MNIDRRRHYIVVLDTETANTQRLANGNLDTSSTLVYDIGWQVVDTHGNVYRAQSWVNKEIFYDEPHLMSSAYYAEKLPQYHEQIADGSRQVGSLYEIRQALCADMEEYRVKEVCAHNARFDLNSLNTTRRWLSKSKYRYFFPYDTVIWDSLKMAKDVCGNMPTYKKFCEKNHYLTKTGNPRFTAEILYRFITGNNNFQESHTGLEDVKIETQILAYCFRQHKKMRKELFTPKTA